MEDVSITQGSVAEMGIHSGECQDCFALLWPDHVSLTWWPHDPGVALKPIFEELLALGSKVYPPFHEGQSRSYQRVFCLEAPMNPAVISVSLPCWLVKGNHQGLIREAKLIPSHACPHEVEVVGLLLRSLFQMFSKHHNVIDLHREE